jgi:phage FluMu gp28-like protein
MCLLTHELIQQAMREGPPIAAQAWSPALRERLQQATGELFLGQDVGRHHDLSVQVVLERQDNQLRVLAILRMAGLRLPDQQTQLATICMLPKFRRACLDMTGLGLGLVEYAQKEPWGRTRIVGINFASTEPVNDFIRAEGRPAETARVTENMATALLKVFEDKTITFAVALDREAMEDLRKPERITSPGGRTSIAAVRDEAGHADLFWALALAVRAAESKRVPVAYSAVPGFAEAVRARHLGIGPLTGRFIL